MIFFQVDMASETVSTIAGTGEKGTDHEGGNNSTSQVCELAIFLMNAALMFVLSLYIHSLCFCSNRLHPFLMLLLSHIVPPYLPPQCG